MSAQVGGGTTWCMALSLDERLELARTGGPIDAERAERRLARWRAQPPFTTDDYFERRLALGGLNRGQLLALLGEVLESEKACVPLPDWAARLEECYSDGTPGPTRVGLPARWEHALGREFWDFVEPLVRGTYSRVVGRARELWRTHLSAPLDPEALESVVTSSLPHELLDRPLRTLVLELNVARLQGELAGADPSERFKKFAARLRDPKIALRLLAEYPVLARQLVEYVTAWGRTTDEILERLCCDWPLIQRTFAGSESAGTLIEIRTGAGDRHRDGRSVAVLSFSSGFRLIYKPRSLSIDAEYQRLLQTLNNWGCSPPWRTVEIVDRATYGWMEFVSAADCGSAPEVRRFYARQGGFLALFYVLRAMDLHFENIVAAGEHPVIVDLESILQPGPPHDDPLASDFLRDSVVRVGLLPVRDWENETSPGLDVSGLGGLDGQLPPRPQPFWARQATDEMHFAREVRPIAIRSGHRPTLNGQAVMAEDYVDDVVEGFTRTYRLLLAHGVDLLSNDGPLSRFATCEVRVLLRPTSVYGLMLRESFHPDFLRDALERERFFDKLWLQVPHRPFLWRVIDAEQKALRRGDVPLFTTRPDSESLWPSNGAVLDDFFTKPAMELIRGRIDGLGERDLKQQLWFVRASIAILSTKNPEREAGLRLTPPPKKAEGDPHRSLVRLAAAIGDHLRESAMEDDDSVQWLGLVPTRQSTYKIELLGTSLYGGLAGVTLFLAYLGHVGGETATRRLAEKSCHTLLQRLEQGSEVELQVGAFEGLSGVIYVLCHLAALWNRRTLLDDAHRLAISLEGRIEEDERLDIINGSAGCAAALASLYRMCPSREVLAIMERCGEQVVRHAVPTPTGIGWLTTGETDVPMTGFSHGTAGIAAVLFELSALSGRTLFRDSAREALAYERSLFSAEHNNWADLRVETDRFDQVNWCHGAPGIGLARTLTMRHEDTPEVRAEIDAAVRTTLARGFGRNHSLCHGDLGNLDLLLAVNALRSDLGLQSEIDRIAAEIVSDIECGGWRCGLPMSVETPGLMTGLAGIGYGLLRLAAPNRVPSVLSLEAPKSVAFGAL